MKTFIKIAGILCLLSVFLTFPACGSDDDDEPEIPTPEKPSTDKPSGNLQDKILGSWISVDKPIYDNKSIITFGNDGTYRRECPFESIENGKYTLSMDYISFSSPYYPEAWISYGFELTDTKLIIHSEPNEIFEKIKYNSFKGYYGDLYNIVGYWIHFSQDKNSVEIFTFRSYMVAHYIMASKDPETSEWKTEIFTGRYDLSPGKLILKLDNPWSGEILDITYNGHINNDRLILSEGNSQEECSYERAQYDNYIDEYLLEKGLVI